jgi:hypothetical protein
MASTDIKDYYRRAWGLEDRPGFKYGGSWADWQTNYSDQMTFEEYLQDDNIVKKPHFLDRKAEGGKVKQPRRKYVAGAFGMAPTLAYPAMVGVAKLLGITTAGLGAKELSNVVTQKIKENPEVLETPQAKAIMLTFGLTPSGLVFGPDADAIEKDKEKFRELLKPGKTYVPDNKGWTESFPDQSDVGKKLTEPPVSGDIVLPPQTGGSEIPETKKEDLIFTSQTAEDVDGEEVISKEEIKETFDKSKILYDQKKMTEVKELTNKEFAEKVANFIDTKHGGRVEAAVKDILGVTEKTKDVENLRARINSLFKNRGIERGRRTGNIAPPSNIDITYDEKVTWSDLTTNISKDKNHLRRKIKKFIKEGKLDPNKYYTLQQLADAFGIEFKDKSQSNNMGYILSNKLKGEIRTTKTGKYPYYHLGDTLKALQNKFKNKKIAGTVKKGAEKYAFNKSFDPELSDEMVNIQDRIANLSKNADIYDDEAIPHWQHAESRDNMGKYPKVFRDSNLKTLQTATLGHPGVNVELMSKKGYEAKKGSIYKELEKLMGKTANKENIETWKKLSERMNDVHIDFFEEIEKKQKDPEVGDSYIGAEKTVVPIKIGIPEIGQKFRSELIYGDMSNVEEILGDIQDINPYAKKFSDLSQEEQNLWRKTVINQYLDHLTDFYKNAGYDDEDLETWQDWIFEGDPAGQTLPLEERAKKPDTDTETKRINKILKKFDIRPSQATDMDITIVKKYGDLIDEDLMRQMLYDQDPQNLAEVMATIDESLIMQNVKGMSPQEIIEATKKSWKRKKQATGGLSGVDYYIMNRYK